MGFRACFSTKEGIPIFGALDFRGKIKSDKGLSNQIKEKKIREDKCVYVVRTSMTWTYKPCISIIVEGKEESALEWNMRDIRRAGERKLR
jgi:hypothetical protein